MGYYYNVLYWELTDTMPVLLRLELVLEKQQVMTSEMVLSRGCFPVWGSNQSCCKVYLSFLNLYFLIHLFIFNYKITKECLFIKHLMSIKVGKNLGSFTLFYPSSDMLLNFSPQTWQLGVCFCKNFSYSSYIVNICVCVCIYIFICVYTCLCTHIYIYIYVCIHVYIYMC